MLQAAGDSGAGERHGLGAAGRAGLPDRSEGQRCVYLHLARRVRLASCGLDIDVGRGVSPATVLQQRQRVCECVAVCARSRKQEAKARGAGDLCLLGPWQEGRDRRDSVRGRMAVARISPGRHGRRLQPRSPFDGGEQLAGINRAHHRTRVVGVVGDAILLTLPTSTSTHMHAPNNQTLGTPHTGRPSRSPRLAWRTSMENWNWVITDRSSSQDSSMEGSVSMSAK